MSFELAVLLVWVLPLSNFSSLRFLQSKGILKYCEFRGLESVFYDFAEVMTMFILSPIGFAFICIGWKRYFDRKLLCWDAKQ